MKNTDDMMIARKLAEEVSKLGGSAYYVGGYVRDKLLGISNKDIDIEIHGVAPSDLERIIDSIGERVTMGESFGIYGIKGATIDIAMPRKEECRGSGHKDFDVFVDPFIGTYKASIRRDFTINALMENVLTGEIIDHHGGREDLKNGIIRHVNDDSFAEDQLRILRAAQFAARFEFKIADETIAICRKMNLDSLARERVFEELKKALLKSHKPSIFFEVLREMNQLDYWFKEVSDLIDTPQNQKFHLEGDVWTHTMMVLDVAAELKDKTDNPMGFMLSALCHDLGKPISITVDDGIIHSYEHEFKGIPVAKRFMNRLTNEASLIRYVLNMVEMHMRPNVISARNSAIKKSNKMFDESVDPLGLIYMAEADYRGMRAPFEIQPLTEDLLRRLDIFNEYMSRPYVMGQDLIDAGVSPGKDFKRYLEFAHKLRLAGIPKSQALSQVLVMIRKEKE